MKQRAALHAVPDAIEKMAPEDRTLAERRP